MLPYLCIRAKGKYKRESVCVCVCARVRAYIYERKHWKDKLRLIKMAVRTFQVVQWLRLWAPKQGAQVRSVVRELVLPATTNDSECHN